MRRLNEIIILSRNGGRIILFVVKKRRRERIREGRFWWRIKVSILQCRCIIYNAAASYCSCKEFSFCVCVCFSSFFDSRVSTPSRHAQITSRLKSRKIFGEDCFLFSVYYFDTMIIFKIQIFSNGLIFTPFSWERKRNDRTPRRQRVDRSATRKTLINASAWEQRGNWFKDKSCKAARGGNRYQVHCDRFQLPPLATREK